MKAVGIKSGFAFSRNPIVLQENFPVYDASNVPVGECEIFYAGSSIFTGRFSANMRMNVAEIVDAFVPLFADPPENNDDPVVLIENEADFSKRVLLCKFKWDNDEITQYTCHVVPGGISRQNHKRLVEIDSDIFQHRFLNPKVNFFLTTRTSAWHLSIKETELYPLYFLASAGDVIRIIDNTGKNVYENSDIDEGVYALDLKALRKYFITNGNILSSLYDVYYNSHFSCRIAIERCNASHDRYRLKFRNSLGVFEIIELTGEISITPEYSDSEDSKFMRYDPITAAFYSDRERIERGQSVSIGTGVKSPDETRFLMDMLASEEVYLLDMTPLPVKVIPSVENMSYSPRPEVPQKFTLKLELSSSETNIMQDILDGSTGRKPRIFSKQFSKQFN